MVLGTEMVKLIASLLLAMLLLTSAPFYQPPLMPHQEARLAISRPTATAMGGQGEATYLSPGGAVGSENASCPRADEVAQDPPARPATFYEGDIIIDSGVWTLNETLELRGNLIIRGDGTLMLYEEADLVLVQSEPYQFGVLVEENGRLILYPGARVRSDYPFNIRCRDGGDISFVVPPELRGIETLVGGSIILSDYARIGLSRDTLLFLKQESAYETNIILRGHASFSCSPGARIVSDYPFNLTCMDEAEATIDEGELFGIYCTGSASVTIDNSTITRIAIGGGSLRLTGGSEVGRIELMFKGSTSGEVHVRPGWISYWSLATNTTITDGPFELEVVNSTVLDWSFSLAGSSSITIRDSEIGSALCLDHSSLQMEDVDFYWVVCRAHSRAHMVGCNGGELACLNETWVEVVDSDLGISLELRGFSGNLTLRDGFINRCYFEAGVTLNLTDCLVQFWHLSLVGCLDVRLISSQLAGLLCYGNTDASVISSDVVSLALHDSSRVRAIGSGLGSIACFGSSTAVLIGSSYINLSVDDEARAFIYWYLTAVTTLLGEPIEGATVSAYVASNGTLVASSPTNSDGEACFVLLEKEVRAGEERSVGPYNVVATYGPYVEEALVELTSNRTVRLELGYTLEICCLDGDGEPIEGIVVRAWAAGFSLSAATGPDGWATLDPLPAQDLTVEAYLWGVLVAKLTLIWGANYTGDLVLEHVPCRVYDLRVRVVDENGNPIAGADVSLVWPNETGIMTKPTGPDGWAVFENVPAGPYKLKVSKEGYEITWSDVALSREDQEHVVTLRLAAQAVISPWLVIAVGAVIGVAALLGVIVLARRRAAKGA